MTEQEVETAQIAQSVLEKQQFLIVGKARFMTPVYKKGDKMEESVYFDVKGTGRGSCNPTLHVIDLATYEDYVKQHLLMGWEVPIGNGVEHCYFYKVIAE